MAGADYLILAVLIVSVVAGGVRGFVREAIALAAWILGIWLAWKYPQWAHPWLGGALADPPVRDWAARVVIVTATLLVGAAVGLLVSWTVRAAVVLGPIDRILGVLFGAVRGVLIVAVFVLVGQALKLDGEKWWRQSKLLPYAGVAAHAVDSLGRRAVDAAAVATGGGD
jgi:membrane protein required for colicin V production